MSALCTAVKGDGGDANVSDVADVLVALAVPPTADVLLRVEAAGPLRGGCCCLCRLAVLLSVAAMSRFMLMTLAALLHSCIDSYVSVRGSGSGRIVLLCCCCASIRK